MTKPDAYADAGVDVAAGNRLVKRIAALAATTHNKMPPGAQVLSGIGGFAAAMSMPSGMEDPVLLASADGVGTKLELACRHNNPATIGVDVVAMCVNDLLCVGATPLFFLDYIACGKLEEEFISAVIAAMSEACNYCECALIGGETAEMPGVYEADGFDIAGFAVGVAEREALITPRGAPGDALIALASSGAHSNGYSLIRKLLAQQPALQEQRVEGEPLIECLLTPTRLYSRSILALRKQVEVRGLAHITGGGISENLARVLPQGVEAAIDFSAFKLPPLFALLQQAGDLSDEEMRRTFNCGVGMIAVVADESAERTIALLTAAGVQAWHLGHLKSK